MSIYKGDELIAGSIPDMVNKSLSNLNNEGQAVIDSKVSKSGDTMSGRLTFETDANEDYEAIYIQNTNIEQNVLPTTNLFERIRFVDKNENYRAAVFYRHGSTGDVSLRLNVVSLDGTDGLTISMGYNSSGNPYFNFPNSHCVDGQWVQSVIRIANGVTWDSSTAEATYSLANYLPNDEYNYEVLITGTATTGTTTGNFVTIGLYSDIITNLIVPVCEARTRTSASIENRSNAIIPVGDGRYIKQYNSTSNNASGTYSLWAVAYRRIGTNS